MSAPGYVPVYVSTAAIVAARRKHVTKSAISCKTHNLIFTENGVH